VVPGADEQGVDAIFTKWTALQLAIDMGWGGQDSEEKGRSLRDEVLDWFYNGKGAAAASGERGSCVTSASV
jgi:hypothetical protein